MASQLNWQIRCLDLCTPKLPVSERGRVRTILCSENEKPTLHRGPIHDVMIVGMHWLQHNEPDAYASACLDILNQQVRVEQGKLTQQQIWRHGGITTH